MVFSLSAKRTTIAVVLCGSKWTPDRLGSSIPGGFKVVAPLGVLLCLNSEGEHS